MKKLRIYIRVTEDEKTQIKRIAQSKKMTTSSYILDNCLGEKSPEVKRKINLELNNLSSSNYKVHNNINQLAKRVNSNQNLSKSDFEKFEYLFKIYTEEISEQNKKINNIKRILLKL